MNQRHYQTPKLFIMEILDKFDKKYSLRSNDDFFFGDLSKRWLDLPLYRDNVFVICGYDGYLDEITDEILYDIMYEQVSLGKRIIFYSTPETIIKRPITKIQNILEYSNLSESDLFFTTGALDGPEGYDKFIKDFGYKKRMRILGCFDFHPLMIDLHHQPPEQLEYQIKLKDKKFLCFNKVDRYHRVYLLAYMLKTNLINEGYYSFEGSDENWTSNFASHRNNTKIPRWVFDVIGKNKTMFPLRLEGGITSERTNPLDISERDLEYFRNSYFSITTETLFYDYNGPYPNLLAWYAAEKFLTEKTYKPILAKHPFIMVGRPGYLKILRDCGFKTFHPFIDETYDTVSDDDERMFLIIQEIERLCSFTDDQWLTWQANVKDIVEHNERHFWQPIKFVATDLNREWFINE